MTPIRLFLFFLSLATIAPTLRAESKFRTMTDAQGRSIEAKLVKVEGDQVTIQLKNGKDYTWPAANFSAQDQAFFQSWQTATSETDSKLIKKLNDAIGHVLFADSNLWDDEPQKAATRLKLPKESQTKEQSSYRAYPKNDFRFLGARPYSIVLYGNTNQVSSISIVFANKGDSVTSFVDKAEKIVSKAIKEDADRLSRSLSEVLGEPQKQSFGEGSERRLVKRWDWGAHSFLLSEEKKEYVGLSIQSVETANNKGKVKRISDSLIKARARSNVATQKNGDVTIQNIPMVNQGPKGYCVPATFERCMRYMSIPADMYILAMAGETSIGGGTSVESMIDGVKRYASSKGRSMKDLKMKLKTKNVAKYIDQGLPLMWTLYSTKAFNNIANKRTEKRPQTGPLDKWVEQIETEAKANLKILGPDPDAGHLAMIVGYNHETDEIAISDSWGPKYEIRWITAQEAEIVARSFYVLSF